MLLFLRVPVANIFQVGNRNKREARSKTNTSSLQDEYDSYDYDLLWDYEVIQDNNITESGDIPTIKTWEKYVNYKAKADEDLPPNIYCDVIQTLNENCLERSLLEIWQYDVEQIDSLTHQEILDAINTLRVSPQFAFDFDFRNLLGGVKKNSTGLFSHLLILEY